MSQQTLNPQTRKTLTRNIRTHLRARTKTNQMNWVPRKNLAKIGLTLNEKLLKRIANANEMSTWIPANQASIVTTNIAVVVVAVEVANIVQAVRTNTQTTIRVAVARNDHVKKVGITHIITIKAKNPRNKFFFSTASPDFISRANNSCSLLNK